MCLFLPRFHCEFAPIEKVWAELKSILRKEWSSYRYMWLYRSGCDGMAAHAAARKAHYINRKLAAASLKATTNADVQSDDDPDDVPTGADLEELERMFGPSGRALGTADGVGDGTFDHQVTTAWSLLRKKANSPVKYNHTWSATVTRAVETLSRR